MPYLDGSEQVFGEEVEEIAEFHYADGQGESGAGEGDGGDGQNSEEDGGGFSPEAPPEEVCLPAEEEGRGESAEARQQGESQNQSHAYSPMT